jgi:hypothetical protein
MGRENHLRFKLLRCSLECFNQALLLVRVEVCIRFVDQHDTGAEENDVGKDLHDLQKAGRRSL